MPRQLMTVAAALLGAAAITLTACGRDERKVSPHLVSRDTVARQLAPGDVRILSADSSIELAVIGDSVVGGFGKKVLDQIKEKTDTNAVSGSGFGASIEKMVKATVAGALDHEIHMPLSEISDVKEEDGLLVFYGKDGKRMNFFTRDHEKAKPSRFSDDDARDFIALFKAKTGRA